MKNMINTWDKGVPVINNPSDTVKNNTLCKKINQIVQYSPRYKHMVLAFAAYQHNNQEEKTKAQTLY